MGRAALIISLVAVALSATIWLSLAGAPLGVVSLALGLVAARRARRTGQSHRTATVAVVLSVIAIVALPILYVACTNGVSCV